MTEIATVRVQILGREFPVACPAGQEHELEAAAEFVDNRMRDIQEKTGNSALERLAVMAALNIAHEHLAGETSGADEDLKRLAERIGTTLERLSESEAGLYTHSNLGCSPGGEVPEPILFFQGSTKHAVRRSVHGKPNVCLRFPP